MTQIKFWPQNCIYGRDSLGRFMIQLRILQAFVYLIIIFLHEKFDIHQIASNVPK